jgi:Predicted transcriptional regulator
MESAVIMSQVFSANLMSRAVSVCMYLLNRTNKHMQCFPGIRTIAKDLKMSEPTVKRALRDLVAAGFVKKETRWRANGGQSSNLYILSHVEKTVETPVETVEIPEDKAPVDTEPRNEATCFELESANAGEQKVQDRVNSEQEKPKTEEVKQIATDTPQNTIAAAEESDNSTVKRGKYSAILQTVLRKIQQFSAKIPSFNRSVIPAPGHEFTPKVNLSVYHFQKGKSTSRKKKLLG